MMENNTTMPRKKKFNISIPKDLGIIEQYFKKNNKKFYLVGGAVRDALMNKTPKDFDIATDASPDEIISILAGNSDYKILDVGKAFGVIRVVTRDNNEYEIATFRKDIGKGRRPDAIELTTIENDVMRRDLTINALFYDIENKEIVDYVGGIVDIDKGNIRTVGNASERFDEDKLRILRAVRFAGRFGSRIDEETAETIKNNNSLEGVSPERIRDEFLKGIKSSRQVIHFLSLVEEFNLWNQIFPGLIVNKQFIENENIPIQIATLLKENKNTKELAKTLNLLKYSADECSQITFLIEFLSLTSETAVKLKKLYKNSKLDNCDVIEFSVIANMPTKIVKAFIDFNFTVTGAELMELGFKGRQLGEEMDRREIEIFKAQL